MLNDKPIRSQVSKFWGMGIRCLQTIQLVLGAVAFILIYKFVTNLNLSFVKVAAHRHRSIAMGKCLKPVEQIRI